jgi:hypothetical protein
MLTYADVCQARWAVAQAVLLIREHKPAYDKLSAAMAAGASLGSTIKIKNKNKNKNKNKK